MACERNDPLREGIYIYMSCSGLTRERKERAAKRDAYILRHIVHHLPHPFRFVTRGLKNVSRPLFLFLRLFLFFFFFSSNSFCLFLFLFLCFFFGVKIQCEAMITCIMGSHKLDIILQIKASSPRPSCSSSASQSPQPDSPFESA